MNRRKQIRQPRATSGAPLKKGKFPADSRPRKEAPKVDPTPSPDPRPVAVSERAPRRGDRSAGGPSGGHWIYGTHAAKEALLNPERHAKRVLAVKESESGKGLKDSPLPVEWVDRNRLDQILGHQAVHQGIAVLVDALPEPDFDAVCEPVAGQKNVVLLLDRITDPHNVGAILRSAAAFGARAVIMTDRHSPEATATLAKAASGALEKVPLLRVTNLARALDDMADLGYWRIGLDGKAEMTLDQATHDINNVALVLGAEGEGMRRLTTDKCDRMARLPIRSAVESLNVSNAAAVALYAVSSK